MMNSFNVIDCVGEKNKPENHWWILFDVHFYLITFYYMKRAKIYHKKLWVFPESFESI
jgi:hypothetical protein